MSRADALVVERDALERRRQLLELERVVTEDLDRESEINASIASSMEQLIQREENDAIERQGQLAAEREALVLKERVSGRLSSGGDDGGVVSPQQQLRASSSSSALLARLAAHVDPATPTRRATTATEFSPGQLSVAGGGLAATTTPGSARRSVPSATPRSTPPQMSARSAGRSPRPV